MKLLPVLIMIIFLVSGCDKATEPTDPEEEEHDQGEVSKLENPPEED